MNEFDYLPKSREEANLIGTKYFYTGKPCKNGHLSKRYIAGYCCECNSSRAKERYAKNPDAEKQRVLKWQKENPDKYRETQLRRRYSVKGRIKARENAIVQFQKRRTMEGTFTKQDIDNLLVKQSGLCNYCFINICGKYHIDHIKPISRGGTNWPSNLQLTCPECNMKKSNKTHEEFLALQIFLKTIR